MGNLGGVFLLVLLIYGLSFAGVLACYVGAVFVLPVSLAAEWVAYRQVFADDEPDPADDVPVVVPE